MKPMRDIPIKNSIGLFFHCGNCMKEKPKTIAPREWSKLAVGWTKIGLQVWCQRCELNIVHIDFENQQHPARLEAR